MRSVAFTTLCAAIAAFPALAKPISDPGIYPLSHCIMSGDPLVEDEIVSKVYDGREMRFCCKMCVKDFEKDQAGFIEKLDAAITASQLPDYPLETCVITGKSLGGDNGDPVDYLAGNRLVRLCSSACAEEVTADPAAAVAKLDAAVVVAQIESYPATSCPVSGEALGSMGEPYDHVFAGKLVRFCCSGCIGAFNDNPTGALARVYGEEDSHETEEHPDDGHHGHDHDGHDGHDHEGHHH